MSGDSYKTLQAALDVEMKDSSKQGLSMITVRPDSITSELEQISQEKGILSGDTPRSLVGSIFWLIGVNFDIWRDEEPRALTLKTF